MSPTVTLSPEIEKILGDLRQAIEAQIASSLTSSPAVTPSSDLPNLPPLDFTDPSPAAPVEPSFTPEPELPQAMPGIDPPASSAPIDLPVSDFVMPTVDSPAAPADVNPLSELPLPEVPVNLEPAPLNPDFTPPPASPDFAPSAPASDPSIPAPEFPPVPLDNAPKDDTKGFSKAHGLLDSVLQKGWNSKK